MIKSNPDLEYVGSEALGADHPDRKLIAETFLQAAATCLRKNADYGSSVFKSPVLAPSMSPESAILVRLSDKIQRMSNLLGSGGTPQVDESVEDNILDMANYALLLIVARRKAKIASGWGWSERMLSAVATGELMEQKPESNEIIADYLVWHEIHPIPGQRPHSFWSGTKFGEFRVRLENSAWVAELVAPLIGACTPITTAATHQEAMLSCQEFFIRIGREINSSPENVDTASTPG